MPARHGASGRKPQVPAYRCPVIPNRFKRPWPSAAKRTGKDRRNRRNVTARHPRLAVIDAATAAEVALITGLTDRLSAEASSQVVQALIDRTRMLGPRLDLGRDLGMALPDRIRPDLLDRRNAVVHRGTTATDTDAQAAITAAAKLVDEYEPLPAHCQEPSRSSE